MLCNHSVAISATCVPPQLPFLPDSDGTIIKYAELINSDFERYFADTSAYSACLDQAHADLIAEVRNVTELHTIFLKRADALGVLNDTVADSSGEPR